MHELPLRFQNRRLRGRCNGRPTFPRCFLQCGFALVVIVFLAVPCQAQFNSANYTAQGRTLFGTGRIREAIQMYSAAIAMDEHNVDAYAQRAEAWMSLGEHDKAVADLDAAIALNPQIAILHKCRGNAWFRKGRYDKAIENYNEALRIDPHYSDARYNLGLAIQIRAEMLSIMDGGRQTAAAGDPHAGPAIPVAPHDATDYSRSDNVASSGSVSPALPGNTSSRIRDNPLLQQRPLNDRAQSHAWAPPATGSSQRAQPLGVPPSSLGNVGSGVAGGQSGSARAASLSTRPEGSGDGLAMVAGGAGALAVSALVFALIAFFRNGLGPVINAVAGFKEWLQSRRDARAARLPDSHTDIVNLHRMGIVCVTGTGQSITEVCAKIENRVRVPVKILIRHGTYFVSRGSHQNMVTRREYRLVLAPLETEHVHVPASCINANLPIPSDSDGFRGVARVSHDVTRFLEAAEGENAIPVKMELYPCEFHKLCNPLNHVAARSPAP